MKTDRTSPHPLTPATLGSRALSSARSALCVLCALGSLSVGCMMEGAAPESPAVGASTAALVDPFVPVGETGRVTLSDTVDEGVRATVTLRNDYIRPVIVAFLNTRAGGHSVDVRVRSVTRASFEIFMQEPDNLDHNTETASYIVVEAGRHILEGGLVVEAGTAQTSTAHAGGEAFAGEAVSFREAFASTTPAVLHTLNSHNNGDFMSSFVTGVTASGFEIGLERAETGKPIASETIAWIAFEPGTGSVDGSAYHVGVGNDGSDDGCDDSPHAIALSGFSARPDVVVSLHSGSVLDGSWARGGGSWTATTQWVYAEEDQILDSERSHGDEAFAWAAFEADTDLIPAARATRWRIRNASVPSSGQWILRELRFCEDAACASPLSGTAIDSGGALSGAPAEDAFDGDPATMWQTADADAEGQSWIGVELSDRADVHGLYLKTDDAAYHSTDLTLEFYDEGAGRWVITDLLTDLASDSEQTLAVSATRSYFTVPRRLNAIQAEAYCASLGTSLATITRRDDDEAAASTCFGGTGRCWIGFNDVDAEGTLAWNDGTPVSYVNPYVTRFNPDSWDCVHLTADNDGTETIGIWNFGGCLDSHAAVGFTCNGPARVREYTPVPTPMTQPDAQAYCESLGEGYELATITSEEENDVVASLCETLTADVGHLGGCWIGLDDMDTEGSPEWDSGAPLIYQNWDPVNGDNNADIRDSVWISSGKPDVWVGSELGVWRYRRGDLTWLPFICSRPVLE